MHADRRQQFLLGALAVAVAVAGYLQWPRAASPMPARGGNGAPVRGAAGASGVTAPDVRLEVLSAARPSPGDHARNLFKFKPKVHVAPPPPARAPEPAPPALPQLLGPPPPPPPPPIALKFIGLLETSGTSKVAILSDGRGSPVHGKEGDAVLGQYKILRINADSIEMSYLDGRGRQTIRLSGS
jgi:hypothetical protein